MVTCLLPFQTVEQVRQYVRETLSGQEQLEIGAFAMTEQLLLQNGQPCGVYFCLHGPRAVKLTAIWETRRNTILFYASNGERFLKCSLSEASPGFLPLRMSETQRLRSASVA